MAPTDFRNLLLRLSRREGESVAPGVVLIVGLTTILYYPALLFGRTLAHGDIPLIDAPLFDFLPRVFRGEVSGLWVHGLYGGHPLFAESQAALANPLNIIWALLVTPIVGPVYAMHLFRWVIMVGAAIGVIGLCRSLGASAWSSTFAALAVIFSQVWVNQQYVLAVFHTLCWIAWVLWAMECLLQRPSLRSASALGAASAALLFAGYPQVLHGTILFALATLAVAPLQAAARREWAAAWKQRVTFGGLAVAIGVGLAAVQLLPLFELTGYSHRHEGVGLPFGGTTPFSSYVKGILFTEPGSNAGYSPGVGSVLVAVLAAMCMLVPAPARAKSYIAGAALLTVLGMEFATPLFSAIYTLHLIPGLSYFRQMTVYVSTATLGIAVVAAFGLDGIAKLVSRQACPPTRPWAAMQAARGPVCLLAAGLIGWSVSAPQPGSNVALQCAILLLCVAVAAHLYTLQRADLLAPLAVALLVAEILLLRIQPFGFWPRTIFSKPPTVAAIQNVPNWRDYRVMDVSLAAAMVFLPPRNRDIPVRVNQLMGVLTPMTTLYWDIPSMDAHLALPLQRRMAIHQQLREEIFNGRSKPPGLRYIDFLGVRFIANGGPLPTPGFRVLAADNRPESQIAKKGPEHYIMENEAALPRFQVYTSYRIVGSLDAALAAMRELRGPSLVVEVPDSARLSRLPPALEGDGSAQAQAAKLEVLSATSTRYRLIVDARQPVWLFVADANYPGWEATIDGVTVPVFSAQVLGKAIAVPSGTHTVAFQFRSWSFQAGLAITLTTLLATVVILGWDLQRRRRHSLQSFAEG